MAAIKPCPFCGSNAELQYGACDYNVYQVVCNNSDNCSAMAGWGDNPDEVIDAWNRRDT